MVTNTHRMAATEDEGFAEVERSSPYDPLSIDFNQTLTEFMANQSERRAIEILEQLLSLLADGSGAEELNLERFYELKGLVLCVLKSIQFSVLFDQSKSLLLTAVKRCPAQILTEVVNHLLSHIDEAGNYLRTTNMDVLVALVPRVVDEQCADSVAKILEKFMQLACVKEKLERMLTNENAERRFRIYQVVSYFLSNGGDPSEVSSFINSIENEIASSDLLLQVNAVEMISDITAANQPEVTSYLISMGIANRLYKLLIRALENPDGGFIFSALVKFFGHLAFVKVESLRNFPKFLDVLFDLIFHHDVLDPSLRLLAFDTLGVIGSTNSGKMFLENISGQYDVSKAMAAFGSVIAMGPNELLARHLDALAMFFQQARQTENFMHETMEQWFMHVGGSFPANLLSYLLLPFDAARIAAERLLLNLLDYDRIIPKFVSIPTFLESVLDRRKGITSEEMHSRFQIVCKLKDSGNPSISAPYLSKIELHIRDGPYYQSKPANIAFESA